MTTPYKSQRRDKIGCLVYKVIEKSLNESSGRINFVLDKMFFLLEFPDLMSLWETVSHISDRQAKEKCSIRFSEVLCGQNSEQDHLNVLDLDFALDVLINFIAEIPEIPFECSLRYMPYIGLCLKEERKEHHLTRLDKICFVFRSLLKEDGKMRVCRLIQENHESMLVGFLSILSTDQLIEDRSRND